MPNRYVARLWARSRLTLALCLGAAALGGCGSNFGETHYFSVVDGSNKPINFFRLNVSGGGGFANIRYVSGYFDERAVDLFLNESKSAPLTNGGAGAAVPSIFHTVDCNGLDAAACTAAQDKVLHIVPVGEKMPANGAFVLIISSNADAIAGTIGSFAENDITLNSAMFLLNHDKLTQAAASDATKPIVDADRNATIEQVGALLDSANKASTTDRPNTYIEVLRTIARGVSSDPPTFTDEATARTWFVAHRGNPTP